MTRPSTALYYDDAFLRHETGQHPECPDRLNWIVARLKDGGLWGRCEHPPCPDASLDDLCLVHKPDYVQHVERMAESGGGMLDQETIVSKGSYSAAVKAAGTGLAAVDAVLRGEARNAFCLVRPPGHHAFPAQGMGFCVFNNIAIAARHLQQRRDTRRIAIFDWDGHHGNGTQAIFYDDASVLFCSIHAYPHWPFSGVAAEQGEGPGAGVTLNRPLPRSTSAAQYLAAAREIITGPMAEFGPEFVLISAGFDAYRQDPLAGMGLESDSYRALTDLLVELADRCCEGRIVSFLEGGYHPEGLALCAAAHVEGLVEYE